MAKPIVQVAFLALGLLFVVHDVDAGLPAWKLNKLAASSGKMGMSGGKYKKKYRGALNNDIIYWSEHMFSNRCVACPGKGKMDSIKRYHPCTGTLLSNVSR